VRQNCPEFVENSHQNRKRVITDRITVEQAAKALGVSKRFIHLGLQRGLLPIGTAVKTSSKWTYYISKSRLEAYIKGMDIRTRTE
jgi:hypothetical protein